MKFTLIHQRNLLTLFILLFVVNCFEATVDLSNLDFSRFRFFRYVQRLPNGEVINTAPPPPSFSDHLARIKAVGTFVRGVVLGDAVQPHIPVAFNPSIGQLRDNFQRKYGYRGWYLIEQLGNGSFRHSGRFTPRWGKKV